ncbi:MAG: hypothetical protein COB53_02425 [Elusimicrobia bacterium]|nr:MAG: hypothetical protein COB53_02425 [Elusimicrobiota bacterium]
MDVLIFDDDTYNAELLTEALRGKGYTTDKYYNGQSAIAEIKRQRPRLVIVDIMMPMMDGLTICRTIKSNPALSHTQVIVTSGKRYKQVQDEAHLCGAAAFLGKPLQIEELRSIVHKLIGAPGALTAGSTMTPRPAASIGKIWGSTSSGGTPAVGQPTSCISIDLGPNLLILDAGTGLKDLLANKQKPIEKQVWLLLSNYQPDRVAGLADLASAFGEEYTLNIVGPNDHGEPLQGVLNKKLYANGPPRPAVQIFAVSESKFNLWAGVRASAIFTLHPRSCLAYRVEFQGRSVVYCPDNEYPTDEESTSIEFRNKFRNFAHAADILVHDARYLDADFVAYKDQGNSSPSAAVLAATEAGVRKLVLFNSDARYGPDALGSAISNLRQKLLESGNPLDVTFAAPGNSFFA